MSASWFKKKEHKKKTMDPSAKKVVDNLLIRSSAEGTVLAVYEIR